MHDVRPINYIAKIKVITVNNNYNSDGKKLKCMCDFCFHMLKCVCVQLFTYIYVCRITMLYVFERLFAIKQLK